jgi:hypothetical protein
LAELLADLLRLLGELLEPLLLPLVARVELGELDDVLEPADVGHLHLVAPRRQRRRGGRRGYGEPCHVRDRGGRDGNRCVPGAEDARPCLLAARLFKGGRGLRNHDGARGVTAVLVVLGRSTGLFLCVA